MLVKLDHFPKFRGEDKKYLKTTNPKKMLGSFRLPLLPFQETPRAIPMAKTCAEAKVKVGSWTEPRRCGDGPVAVALPIGSMYGIFTYIWLKFMVNVGKYPIHGWYGL